MKVARPFPDFLADFTKNTTQSMQPAWELGQYAV